MKIQLLWLRGTYTCKSQSAEKGNTCYMVHNVYLRTHRIACTSTSMLRPCMCIRWIAISYKSSQKLRASTGRLCSTQKLADAQAVSRLLRASPLPLLARRRGSGLILLQLLRVLHEHHRRFAVYLRIIARASGRGRLAHAFCPSLAEHLSDEPQ